MPDECVSQSVENVWGCGS